MLSAYSQLLFALSESAIRRLSSLATISAKAKNQRSSAGWETDLLNNPISKIRGEAMD
jgi:hypothetical protein